jgi:TRAP-type mannitol/chloroaromatic compound transport system permease small subunit
VLTVAHALERIVSAIGRTAMWLFLPLVAVILFDVITRKIPGFSVTVLQGWLGGYVSSTKLQELEWHLHAGLFALVLGWAYLCNAHVRVDLLREKAGHRVKLWIELLGAVLMLLPFFLLLLWYGVDFVAASYRQGEGSAAMTGLGHRWIIKAVFFGGVATVFLAGLAVLLRVIAVLRSPHPEASFEAAVFPDAPRGPVVG